MFKWNCISLPMFANKPCEVLFIFVHYFINKENCTPNLWISSALNFLFRVIERGSFFFYQHSACSYRILKLISIFRSKVFPVTLIKNKQQQLKITREAFLEHSLFSDEQNTFYRNKNQNTRHQVSTNKMLVFIWILMAASVNILWRRQIHDVGFTND